MASLQTTDDELIARVRSRDKTALESLYARHSAAALGLAMRIVGERSSAEEIVQEAFWRVWKRAATFQSGRGQFAAWLSGIVHNLAIDELRRRRSRPASTSIDSDDKSAVEIPDERTDVAESAWQEVSGAQVRAALAGLPEAQRRVIELAYFEGLTHQEIAEQLSEPVGTVHTRARLGLLKLRELLKPLQPDSV